jgi:hypothetical protein
MRALRWVTFLGVGVVLAGCLPVRPPSGGRGVGHIAPPLEGADADGAAVSLREQRGKVVLLTFWHSS